MRNSAWSARACAACRSICSFCTRFCKRGALSLGLLQLVPHRLDVLRQLLGIAGLGIERLLARLDAAFGLFARVLRRLQPRRRVRELRLEMAVLLCQARILPREGRELAARLLIIGIGLSIIPAQIRDLLLERRDLVAQLVEGRRFDLRLPRIGLRRRAGLRGGLNLRRWRRIRGGRGVRRRGRESRCLGLRERRDDGLMGPLRHATVERLAEMHEADAEIGHRADRRHRRRQQHRLKPARQRHMADAGRTLQEQPSFGK